LKDYFGNFHQTSDSLNEICQDMVSNMIEIYDRNTKVSYLKTRDVNFVMPKLADHEYVSICNHIHNVQEKVWKLATMKEPCDNLMQNLYRLKQQKLNMGKVKSFKYYSSLIYENPRQSWKVLNEMCGRNKGNSKLTLCHNGIMLHDDEDTANVLQNHFLPSKDGVSLIPLKYIKHRGPFVDQTFHFQHVKNLLRT
jgi:hypothetical protein